MLSLQSSPFLNIFNPLLIEFIAAALGGGGGIQIQLDDLSTPHVLTGCQQDEEGDVLILSGTICAQDLPRFIWWASTPLLCASIDKAFVYLNLPEMLSVKCFSLP